MRKLSIKLSFLLFTVFTLSAMKGMAQKTGKEIFQSRCTACHRISNDKLVGPGLAHVTKRRDQEWLIKFIRNSQKMIENGNEQAKEIFNEFNQTIMPANPDLSDQEIKNVLSYIKEQSKGIAQQAQSQQKTASKKSGGESEASASKIPHLPPEQEAEKNYKYNPDSFNFQTAFITVAIMLLMAVFAFIWMVVYFTK